MKTAQRSVALCLIFVIFCSLLPSALAASTGTINTDKVFFRVKPHTKAEYYSLLKKGAAVTVTGTSGSFYSVTCDGHSGYVMKKFVTLSADSAKETSAAGSNSTKTKESKYVTASHISDLGSVPAATKKGSKGDAVEKLQQALKIKGYYKAPIDSKYGEKTMEAVKAFQRAKGLAVDGIAGNTTIKALFGKNAANYTYVTERLDWFSTGVHIFNGSCTYTIKDVYTGKTFKAQRRFGSNHLDTEPLTAADTATLKSIYGGSWSWTRRPILVLYNGHVYAASMNGMPHGTCSITNNNFDGHFCIHFYNSPTQETTHADAEHQSCVPRAMSATW